MIDLLVKKRPIFEAAIPAAAPPGPPFTRGGNYRPGLAWWRVGGRVLSSSPLRRGG